MDVTYTHKDKRAAIQKRIEARELYTKACLRAEAALEAFMHDIGADDPPSEGIMDELNAAEDAEAEALVLFNAANNLYYRNAWGRYSSDADRT